MAITRLKRKDRKNKSRATNKIVKIQYLNRKPVIKQVDIEKIKDEFAQKGKGKKAPLKADEKAAVINEVVAVEEVKVEAQEEVAETKVAEKKKPAAKKASAKKITKASAQKKETKAKKPAKKPTSKK